MACLMMMNRYQVYEGSMTRFGIPSIRSIWLIFGCFLARGLERGRGLVFHVVHLATLIRGVCESALFNW